MRARRVTKAIPGDEFAKSLFRIYANERFPVPVRIALMALLTIIVIGCILLLMVFGVYALIQHVDKTEIGIGIACVLYGILFFAMFVKEIITTIKDR